MTTNNIILALRSVAQNKGNTGKTISIQGICDIMEEFLGVDREKFKREIVQGNVILDAAIEMWHKKVRKANIMHHRENVISYDEMREYDEFYMDSYDLYNIGFAKNNKKLYQEFIFHKSIMSIDDEAIADMENSQAEQEEYMNEPWDEPDYDLDRYR